MLEKKGEGIRGREKQKRENCEGIIFQERKNGARERGKSTGKSEEKMLSRGSKKREKRAHKASFPCFFANSLCFFVFNFVLNYIFFFFVFVLAMVFGLFCVGKYQLILWIDDCLLLLLLLL